MADDAPQLPATDDLESLVSNYYRTAAAARADAGTAAPTFVPPHAWTGIPSASGASSSPPLQQQHLWPWLQLQPDAFPPFSSFLSSGPENPHAVPYSMPPVPFFWPYFASASLAQPVVVGPPPLPELEMQSSLLAAAQTSSHCPPSEGTCSGTAAPSHSNTPSQQMAAPAAAGADAPVPPGASHSKPAPRRRGRPPSKTTTTTKRVTARSNRAATAAASRRTPHATDDSAAISAQVQVQQLAHNAAAIISGGQVQLEQPAANNAATATSGQAAPCTTEPTAESLDNEQCQVQSVTGSNSSSAGEAIMAPPVAYAYADTSAVGVRFRPTDEEIVVYLRMKHAGQQMPVDFIREFDVYGAHPETIRDACGESVHGCWYVFSPRCRKYVKGKRPARSVRDAAGTQVGYWKSNTKLEEVHVGGGAAVGEVTSLTFHLGKQPDGTQTPWKMTEYAIPENEHKPDGSDMLLNDRVFCKLFYKERAKRRQGNKDKQINPVGHEDQAKFRQTEKNKKIIPVGQEDNQIIAVGQEYQSGVAGDSVSQAGDEDRQMVPAHWTNGTSEQELRVEDYLVSDPVFPEQNHDAV